MYKSPNDGGGRADLLTSSGWKLCPQTPISVILHCKFFSLHLPHKALTLSESTKRYNYFLVILAGVNQTFGVEKIMLHSYAMTTEIITISFKFFSFCPPTHFALTPPQLKMDPLTPLSNPPLPSLSTVPLNMAGRLQRSPIQHLVNCRQWRS